jgi:hypothetical protein
LCCARNDLAGLHLTESDWICDPVVFEKREDSPQPQETYFEYFDPCDQTFADLKHRK